MKSRQTWPVRRYRLGEEPADDLTRTTTAEERLEASPRRQARRLNQDFLD